MKKIPQKVKNCVTHHHACPCREYRYREMESALKVIHIWASFDESNNATMKLIAEKAAEGLGLDDD